MKLVDPLILCSRWSFYLIRPHRIFIEAWEWAVAFVQRGLYGFANRDCWSLCSYLSKWMPTAIRKTCSGIGVPFPSHDFPGNNSDPIKITDETWEKWRVEWKIRVDKMARAFEAFAESEDDVDFSSSSTLSERENFIERDKKRIAEMREGLELFAKNFESLWD